MRKPQNLIVIFILFVAAGIILFPKQVTFSSFESKNETNLAPHVFIIEDDGSLAANVKDDLSFLTKKFYEQYPDHYDFIGFHFKNGAIGANTFAYKVQDLFEQGNFEGRAGKTVLLPNGKVGNRLEYFGSSGRLLGGYVVSFDFNKQFVKQDKNNDPISLLDNFYFSLLFHELTHYWGVNLPDQLKEALVFDGTKYDQGHWEFFTGSWIAVKKTTRLKLIETRPRTYSFLIDCSSEPKHHDFDLYSIGLKSSEEVQDKLVVTGQTGRIPGFVQCDTPLEVPDGFVRKTFTIQDMINVLGPRVPSSENAKKDFTIAFVLIVPKGDSPNRKEIKALNWIAKKFPLAWYKSTEKRSTLNALRPSDVTPPRISNVKTSARSSSISVRWITDEPAASFVIYTAPSANSIGYPAGEFIKNPPKFSTRHKIVIKSKDFTPITPHTEYSIKIISIDREYNMASFDAGKVRVP